MLPEKVFNHLTYSNCKPGACVTVGNYEYSLTREWAYPNNYDVITGSRYDNRLPIGTSEWYKAIKTIKPSDVPETNESDWRIYVTHEC